MSGVDREKRREGQAPPLREAVLGDFRKSAGADLRCRDFLKRVENGTASGADAADYAGRLGLIAAECVIRHTGDEEDGFFAPLRMTGTRGAEEAEAARAVIEPLLREVYERIMDAAAAVQEAEDRKNGIGMKAARPPFPVNRVRDLIDKAVEVREAQHDE